MLHSGKLCTASIACATNRSVLHGEDGVHPATLRSQHIQRAATLAEGNCRKQSTAAGEIILQHSKPIQKKKVVLHGQLQASRNIQQITQKPPPCTRKLGGFKVSEHHVRPRRASATALLRIGADTCQNRNRRRQLRRGTNRTGGATTSGRRTKQEGEGPPTPTLTGAGLWHATEYTMQERRDKSKSLALHASRGMMAQSSSRVEEERGSCGSHNRDAI